ncbi:FG-GAP repeat protein [Streptomyces sp. 11x1]|uniref:FG-GAP repeat protein n=1 Tax=Streptomyces sp. 11x1 TaxID=3038642 RepID=UPI00292D9357|nr:FG-GAP repeat protein [Streptomyces sp. 11x1]WNZ09867.1 FG-GAP repeat protein [Streptomyces sp. 11x1]
MHRRTRTALAVATVAALTGGLAVTATGTASAVDTPAIAQADFNADGYGDVAVSAGPAYVNGRAGAGTVTVVYGGASGNRYATISQNTSGVPGTAEQGDYFGADTAYGDFDGDGYDDLAVGAPGEDVGGDTDGGTAVILWGSASGLKGGTTLTDPRPTKHDLVGRTLEAGDFDGDGKDDIALGSSGSTVDVHRGGFGRTKGTTGGRYTAQAPIYAGAADGGGPLNLHSGDIDGDGTDDLIVNGYATDDDYNANYWLPGGANGATGNGAQRLPAGIITDIGDTDEDGYGDIVIGIRWDEGVAGANKGGTAHIVHGTADGPAFGDTQTFTQDSAGVPGASESGDSFADEIDLGDVNGDGHLDLVVGAPGENLAGVADTGAVTVLYGAADGSGITGQGARFLSQDTPGVPNSNETNDLFGSDVRLTDLDGDGRADVVVGALGENAGNGAVYALRSGADGTLSASSGIYTSTVGISASGSPQFGHNFAD